MRIIGGSQGGIILKAPTNLPVRPTTDRAKESLFNILENHFNWEMMKVLDLFSGTGNISFECCSRGVQSVQAVDQDGGCIHFIKATAAKHAWSHLKSRKQDAFVFLKNSKESFDFIFADPPYALPGIADIPRLVIDGDLLNPNGWLVVEHGSHLELSHQIGFFDKRIYGQSTFSFFRKQPSLSHG